MLIVAFLFLFVAWGPQVVLSAFTFKFGALQQCAPIQVTFSGNRAVDRVPSSLLILPFNSTPISIPIPDAASNSTGVTISFLPLAAGTQFMASLDDDTGDNAARVSDVFKIEPSPTGDSSCLPAVSAAPPFVMPTLISQCQPFSVGYETSSAPSVRVFLPNIGSFPLDVYTDVPEEQRAIYVLNVTHGFPVLLMAFPPNDPSNGATSALLTVGGEATSDTSCIKFPSSSSNKDKSSPPGVSKGLIIGFSVGGAVVFVITLMMIFWLVHQRRQRRLALKRAQNSSPFSPDMEKHGSEKLHYSQSPGFVRYGEYIYAQRDSSLRSPGSQKKPLPPSPGYSLSYERGFVKDPPYTAQNFSPSHSNFDEPDSMHISWMVDPAVTAQVSRATSTKATIRSAKTASSINPYDIEHMLDEMAQNATPSPMPPPRLNRVSASELKVPPPINVQVPARGHFRSPVDVPPSSMVSYSNVFDNAPIYDSPISMSSEHSITSSSNFEILTRRPHNGIIITSLLPGQVDSRFSGISASSRRQEA